jgi:HK97 family phage portal protein
MSVGTTLARAWSSLIGKAAEGTVREGPYFLPITGGILPAGAPWNYWQVGIDPMPYGARSAMVEACVSAYAQTVAMCPGDHWRANEKGGRDRVTNTALARILRHPNAYQSISDFLLNATRQLYLDGNAYALAIRNDRYEIAELHLMDSARSRPYVAAETGDIFYRLGGNEVIENQLGQDDYDQMIVPARDVLHIRLHSDRRYPFPLIGETPLMSGMADLGVNDAITKQQVQFYLNQARPSAVLSTDLKLDKDQVQFLRDRWDEQSAGLNQGRTPILTAGLKVQPWTVPGKDAAIAEMANLTQDRIALLFRVPLPVLGLPGPTFGSTEAMMQFWISTGLGFCLNHIEESLGLLFQLRGQPDEYVEFDTGALLRSNFKDRIEALARAVQGGILSPNEARNKEGYDKVEHGDEPRVQQQVVPLSAAAAIPTAGNKPPPGEIPPSPGPQAPPSAPPAAAPKEGDEDVKRIARQFFARSRRHVRHGRRVGL